MGRLSREKAKSRDTDSSQQWPKLSIHFHAKMTISFPPLSSSSPFHSLRSCCWRVKTGDMQKVQLESVVPLCRFLINIHQRRLDGLPGMGLFIGTSVCVGDLNTLSLWLTSIHQTHPYFNECQWAITQELGIKSGKRIVERGHKLNIFPFAHLIPKIASSRLFPPLR